MKVSEETKSESKPSTSRSNFIAVVAMLAAAYAALGYLFSPISFLVVQFRVADMLYALTPLFGLPAVFGLSLGVFLVDLSSPLRPYDLFSCLFSFAGLLILYKLRSMKGGVLLGLGIYSAILSLWVGFMLSVVFHLPYPVTTLYVGIGIFASDYAGYPLYKALERRGVRLLRYRT